MARQVTTVRLSEDEDRQVSQLMEWLYDQSTGPIRPAVTPSDAIRFAIRQAHAQGPGARQKNPKKS